MEIKSPFRDNIFIERVSKNKSKSRRDEIDINFIKESGGNMYE